MNTDYANSSIENKACDLLSPLVGACPDSIWENISLDLEARRAKINNRWVNKFANAPKSALIASGAVAVITLCSWMFLMNKSSKKDMGAKSIVTQPAPKITQVAIAESKPVTPPSPAPAVNNNNVVIAQQPVVQPVIPQQKKPVVPQSPKQVPTVTNTPPVQQQANNSKTDDDNQPIIIHSDADGGSMVTTPGAPGGKGVEIDLNKSDDNPIPHSVTKPVTQVTAGADTAQ